MFDIAALHLHDKTLGRKIDRRRLYPVKFPYFFFYIFRAYRAAETLKGKLHFHDVPPLKRLRHLTAND
jgi:hypothetical protein